VLRRISERREEVTGDWIKLNHEELHNLYTSSHVGQFKEHEMGGACGMHEKDSTFMKHLFRKSAWKRV
jgi:hypothetical protein